MEREGGFDYQSFAYDGDGNLKYKDGKPVIIKGKLTSKIDDKTQKRVIIETKIDENGKETVFEYTSIGQGLVEYFENGVRKVKTVYKLSETFDKNSKSTTGVLEYQKQAIAESEEYINARNENEAADALTKQQEEKIAEQLQSEKQRARVATKNYTAKGK